MSHPVRADALMGDESHHADADIPRPVGPNPSDCWGGFEPTTRLRTRIEKLAHKRIDASRIKFPKQACEFHGGHATVLKAHMNDTGKNIDKPFRTHFPIIQDVAVKKMRIADDTDFERVLGLAIREAEFLVELVHPNIANFQGFVVDLSKSAIWLVFPWAHNGNLKDFVASRDWEIPERIWLINDVVQGLAYLHNQEPPICHGDLKSLNVLVDRNRRASITDFGSARHLSRRDTNTQIKQDESQPCSAEPLSANFCASTNTITLTGNKYTLRWAAPELLVEDQLSLWSDIWALGWIAYEARPLNLYAISDVSSDIVVVERVLGGELPPLTGNAHLSIIHELCSLMTMCWKARPTERPTADYCRESIQGMPMFVPGADRLALGDRTLPIHRLGELGRMYRSRGDYARAFDFFVKAVEHSRKDGSREWLGSSLRDLAQLHQLRNEYSEAIALYSEIRESCVDVADDLCNLAQLHRRRNEYNKAIELSSSSREIQEEERIAEALSDLANAHRLKTQYNEATRLYLEALETSTEIGYRKGRADAARGLAEAYRHRREYSEAIPLYSDALKICTELGDQKGKSNALWGLAEVYRHQGEYDRANPLYSEALKIHISLGDSKGRAGALWALAEVHRHRKKYDEAIPLYSEALEIRTSLGDSEGRADALGGLADVHRDRSEYDEAIRRYSEVLKIRTDLGITTGRADALCNLAQLHRLQNEYNKTIEPNSQHREVEEERIAKALSDLADEHRLKSQYNEALRLYLEALYTSTEIGYRKGRADALRGLIDVDQHCEDDEAIRLYSEALKIRTNLRSSEGRADALRAFAEVHRHQRRYNEAIRLYSEALETHTSLGDSKGRADSLRGLADVYQRRSMYNKAISLYSEVSEICFNLDDRIGRADALHNIARLHRLRDAYNKAIGLNSHNGEIEEENIADALCDLANESRLKRQYDKAITLYSDALEIRASLGDSKGRADALWALADVHRYIRKYDEAIRLHSEALEIRTSLGDSKGRADALGGLADAHRHRGEYDEAIRLHSEALEIRTSLGDSKGRADAVWALAGLHRHRRRYREAIRLYFEALKIRNRDRLPKRRNIKVDSARVLSIPPVVNFNLLYAGPQTTNLATFARIRPLFGPSAHVQAYEPALSVNLGLDHGDGKLPLCCAFAVGLWVAWQNYTGSTLCSERNLGIRPMPPTPSGLSSPKLLVNGLLKATILATETNCRRLLIVYRQSTIRQVDYRPTALAPTAGYHPSPNAG
ncbi:hypothetical protein M407DRAFT_31537 [Tulasnella calospora MUT 4182]|uniref:Protein kinase domain-containing protein n=1 Tax=Tulasnella calospora MUT 4182 TaxID=1051891 RepID=A0A0C3LBB6_9AGAM|nr:hypothetical protein M407DRAFT_31537 [Tulasnella calospora MUT 4182]